MQSRIIIADDHQLLIDGLMAVLREEGAWEILEPVNNGMQLLDRLANTPVDLVLLDLNMPQLDGIKTLGHLKREFPQVKILVITNYNQPQLMMSVEELGADGYMLKSTSATELKSAIRKILQGEKIFTPLQEEQIPIASYFLDDFMKKYQLTKREVEIIKMISSEFTSKEIGQQLFISEFTVNTHRKNIMRKLEVKNMAGLMNFARVHGLC
ncbi:LuxR family two component transcriptional regulator [Chitinophaga skermanii]|uniref:LuxR family two component transcriptional regulator n=1 Tax=Chitinophaga skermanii TaxID=331697 RepID=A0A327Q4P9_9BACT|nr:response regulator transcription factor [Chitinophaga skermanii]RAI98747.1 LuxR family two component transcriptional regulator [Chitinophaga skermanii]